MEGRREEGKEKEKKREKKRREKERSNTFIEWDLRHKIYTRMVCLLTTSLDILGKAKLLRAVRRVLYYIGQFT